MSSGGEGRGDDLGMLKKEHRRGGLSGVENEAGWKLVSYIWIMLGWRSPGDTQVRP